MATFEITLVDEVSGPAKKASKSISDLDSQMGSASKTMGGGGGGLSGETADLGEELGITADAALAAAAAVAALAAAAVVAGGALAVTTGEAVQGFQAMASAQLGSAEAGDKALEMVDALSESLPIARDKMREMAAQLMSAGVRDLPSLEKALKATAAATALLGDSAGAKVQSLISKTELLGQAGKSVKNLSKALQGTGLDAEDLAKQLGIPAKQLDSMLKSGKISSKQLGDALQDALIAKGANAVDVANNKLSVMWDKFKAGLLSLFDGIVETPGYKEFVAALKNVGQVLGGLFGVAKDATTSAFGAIFGIAAKVITYTTIGLLKLATMFVRLYIFMFPVISATMKITKAIAGFFAMVLKAIVMNDTFVKGLKILGIALLLAAAPLIVIQALGLIFIAVIAAIVAAIVWVVGWIADHFVPILKILGVILAGLIGGPIALAIAAWFFFADAIKKVIAWIGNIVSKVYNLGASLVAGLVGGMMDHIPEVAAAGTKVGNAAADAMAKATKTHSPSEVTMKIGQGLGQGLELGVASTKGDVHAAGAVAGKTAVAGIVAGGSSSSTSNSKSLTVHVAPGAIVIQGGGGDALSLTREAVAQLFEEAALSQGLGAT